MTPVQAELTSDQYSWKCGVVPVTGQAPLISKALKMLKGRSKLNVRITMLMDHTGHSTTGPPNESALSISYEINSLILEQLAG